MQGKLGCRACSLNGGIQGKRCKGRGTELRILANVSVVLEALMLLEPCSLVHFVYFTDSVFY